MPSLICKQCQHDLQIAIDFRRVCIEAQELLQLKTFADKDDETVLEFGNENDIELMPGSHYEIDEMSEVPTEAQEAAAELSEYESADGLLELPVGVADTSGFPSDYIEFDEELGLSSDSDSPQQPLDDRESSDISCSSCGLGFDTLEDLRTHKYQLHDVSRNTSCEICHSSFKQLKHYQAHLKSTTHKVLVVREGAKARVRAKAIV
ncbi:hypothetical protein KR009_007110, partial [Drosophila setifemur]